MLQSKLPVTCITYYKCNIKWWNVIRPNTFSAIYSLYTFGMFQWNALLNNTLPCRDVESHKAKILLIPWSLQGGRHYYLKRLITSYGLIIIQALAKIMQLDWCKQLPKSNLYLLHLRLEKFISQPPKTADKKWKNALVVNNNASRNLYENILR